MVPSTQVAHDAFAERREIQREIAELKTTRDALLRDVADARLAHDDVVQRSELVPETHKKLEVEHRRRIETHERTLTELKSTLESVEKKLGGLKDAARILEEKNTSLSTKNSQLEQDIVKHQGEYAEVIAHLQEHKALSEETELETKETLKQLNEAVETAKRILVDTTAEHLEKMAEIARESTALSTRRDDLEIWEARLRAQYPDVIIHL